MSVTKVDGGIRTDKGTFLPFIKVKGGKDYLQVMHRLVWFREEYPQGSIDTQAVELNDKFAVMRATVSTGTTLLATGYKREDLGSFGDYMEKAETGAIGRALAACGFGTQFAPELDEGERIVDSPVASRAAAAGPYTTNIPLSTIVHANSASGLDATNTPTAMNATNTPAKKGFKRVDVPVTLATGLAGKTSEEDNYT